MRGNVTVSEALSKGRKTLVYFPMVLIFGFIGIAFYVGSLDLVEGYVIALIVLLGIILACLSWSINVNKWKIWAYENVRNVHELKRKAIEEKLIWNDGSWFEKTEFKSYEQKQKLNHLEKKFLEKDVYVDDITIPKETQIFYSKGMILFGLVFGLFFIGVTVYFYFRNDNKDLFFLLPGGLGIYFIYTSIVKIIKKEPQISINSEGIKLYKKDLMSWDNITNDFVIKRKSGKQIKCYLAFDFKIDRLEVELNELGIDNDKLENLLRVYRVRYEKNNPN